MESMKVPYSRMVFVCANKREDGRQACANPGAGGDELCRALKDGVKAAGLQNRIRVSRSGCMGMCGRGPNVVIWPEGECLTGVRPEDAPEILEKLKA